MSDLLEALNPAQREAVLHAEGPLLVLAGAGSGKTRVIVHRIAHLVRAHGVPPSAILAVTFTNKAAGEMKERVGRLLPGQGGVMVSTFHSACLRILRAHIHHLGYKNDFVVYDAADSVALIKVCMETLSVNVDLYPPRSFAGRISGLKTQGITPDAFAERAASFGPDGALRKVYALYQEKLRQAHGVDFDDLIGLTGVLLSSQAALLEQYHARFSHILVDEYQDTNAAQYHLIRLLTSPRRNLCVVGDDDQSIYAFRGADVGNILEFERDFPDAKIVVLNQNYRSTRSILDAAASVIEKNGRRKPKQLWTQNDAGDPVTWARVANEEAEGRVIRDTVLHLGQAAGRSFADFAILYRTNAQSRVIEETLRAARIAYTIVGGLRFYDRKEVKDLIAYLRLIVRPEDDVSFRRVVNLPTRGIGSVTLDRLAAEAARREASLYDIVAALCDPARLLDDDLAPHLKRGVRAFYQTIETLRGAVLGEPPFADAARAPSHQIATLPDLIRWLIAQIAYLDYLKKENPTEAESRAENVMEFVAAAEQHERLLAQEGHGEMGLRARLAAFLDQVALVTSADGAGGGGVVLMTLHAAKGLEFPVVFLVGMEDGLFPHSRALTDPKEMEEERRLCYVGMTRARERLYLISADERKLHGALHFNPPSRFILDLQGKVLRSGGAAVRKRVDVDADRYDRGRWNARPGKNGNAAMGRWVDRTTEDGGYRHAEARGTRPDVSIATPPIPSEGMGIHIHPIGTNVLHPTFGMGRVQRYEGSGEGLKVSVAFGDGVRKLSVKHARLDKI